MHAPPPPSPLPIVTATICAAGITSIKAGALPESALPFAESTLLCQDYIQGFCRQGDVCSESHKICRTEEANLNDSWTIRRANCLSLDPRLPCQSFGDDGPGSQAELGPRHDNDHIEIEYIQILPTMDEILSLRPPYIPSRDPNAQHRLPLGPSRLLDINFRQLRYESVESIIDCVYHASQQLHSMVTSAKSLNEYDEHMITPKGSRYFLFRDVAFEDIMFHDLKGVMFRISYACPPSLRATRMGTSGRLEDGMLVALVGLFQDNLSVTFAEIHQRQSTAAMKPRTGNNLRAAVILSLADLQNVSAVRRLLYNAHGIIQETIVLVEIPDLLYAGFYWTLKRLQSQSVSDESVAFSSTIAPTSANANPDVSPPNYTMDDKFSFQLDILKKSSGVNEINQLTLKPADLVSDQEKLSQMVEQICQETTFDRGQAIALCESLCRGLAFTQGPPGTGKTYLGVGLAKVLLASRPADLRKPILVVCMTNHALDSFLSGLREAGIERLARFGSQSREDWTRAYQLRNIAKKVKKNTYEKSRLEQVRYQEEALTTEGRSWCEALNDGVLSWPAVREYLQAHQSHILSRFTQVEKSDQSTISDIRLARKAGGFAFKYWCEGGDINDVDLLVETFGSLLGRNGHFDGFDPRHLKAQERVRRNIAWNAKDVQSASSDDDIWMLTLPKRRLLLEEWNRQIEAQSILDRTAEVHRRHQDAISRRQKILSEFDTRVLQNIDIVASTMTSCAMNWQKLEGLCLRIVICEEAGEVMEAHSLCTLFPSIEHAISIGDPLQLRPQVNEQCLSLETSRGSQYRLDESLMERLILPTTIATKPIPYSRLNIQRRMHPDIADIMRATLYPYLEDHDSTASREEVAGVVDRIFWLDHNQPEDLQGSRPNRETSSSNAYEVQMVAGMVEYLVGSNEYNYKDIAVLTPYNGKLAAFMERLGGICSLWLSEKDRDALIGDGLLAPEDPQDGLPTNINMSDMLRLATIDNFQGEESKIVILSTVRSNDLGRVGFMKTSNRINVACSRARNGFYIIGNATLMEIAPMWRQITNLLTLKGKIGSSFRICCPRHREITYYIREPHQWHMLTPCQALCEHPFPCGHLCGMRCHAPALHERIGCTKPCERVYEMCSHVCSGLCGQPCGDCTHEQVSLTLACGHNATLGCAEIRAGKVEAEIACQHRIGMNLLECGHTQDVICSRKGIDADCTEKCGQLLDCGHQCSGYCSSCKRTGAHSVCQIVCQRVQTSCHHLCRSTCHLGSDCPPCQQPCEIRCMHGRCENKCGQVCEPCVESCDWECEHQGSCTSLCSLPCDRLPCSEPCSRALSCGHICPSLCGERCANQCLECITEVLSQKPIMFLPCGHRFELDLLDAHVGIGHFYEFDDRGHIRTTVPASRLQTQTVVLQCPTCNKSIAELRRYSLVQQSRDMDGVVDRFCAQFARTINHFLRRTYEIRKDLDASFQFFQKTIRPGPLTGRMNEQSIRMRGSALDDLQSNIIRFRDDKAAPLETAMVSLAKHLNGCNKFSNPKMSFRIRLDLVYQRCRLITLGESARMVKTLEGLSQQSRHSTIMIGGLRALSINQAKHHSLELTKLAAECEEKYLKRLECEAHLVNVCFHIILQDLGDKSSNHGEVQHLEKALHLCTKFPGTAGLLLPAYYNIKLVATHKRGAVKTFFDTDSKSVWWQWPNHDLGALEQCSSGHLYSSETWQDCPECGKEVENVEDAPPTPLQNEQFLLAMQTAPETFDGGAYRRRAS